MTRRDTRVRGTRGRRAGGLAGVAVLLLLVVSIACSWWQASATIATRHRLSHCWHDSPRGSKGQRRRRRLSLRSIARSPSSPSAPPPRPRSASPTTSSNSVTPLVEPTPVLPGLSDNAAKAMQAFHATRWSSSTRTSSAPGPADQAGDRSHPEGHLEQEPERSQPRIHSQSAICLPPAMRERSSVCARLD